MGEISYETQKVEGLEAALSDLASILHACVASGASVSFIEPFSLSDAEVFWREKVFPEVRIGNTLLIVANVEGRIVGTVQLMLSMPPNQPHRCEVAKLLVHPDYRKKGIAKKLMKLLEAEARAHKKSLITLDTRSGDNAEPLYTMLGYETAGQIPNFARATDSDRLDATTYMYKLLS